MTDPPPVPSIWSLYIVGSERIALAAIEMLGQIDGPAASSTLAALAIFCPRSEVRNHAFDRLLSRDLREIMTRLIGMIRMPFKYQVRPVDGPGSTGVLFVEGEKFNVERVYRSMPVDPSLVAKLPPMRRPNTPLMVENQLSLPANIGLDPFGYLAAQVASTASSSRKLRNGLNQLQQVHRPTRRSPKLSHKTSSASKRSMIRSTHSTPGCCRSSSRRAGRSSVPSLKSGRAGGRTSWVTHFRPASPQPNRPLPTSSMRRAGRPRWSASAKELWSTRPAAPRQSRRSARAIVC